MQYVYMLYLDYSHIQIKVLGVKLLLHAHVQLDSNWLECTLHVPMPDLKLRVRVGLVEL